PTPPTGAFNSNNNIPTLRSLDGGGVSLRADQELGAVNLVSITAFRKSVFTSAFDLDRTPANVARIDNVQRDRQFSQEVQLSSRDLTPLRWILGGYYFHARSAFDPSLVYTPLVTPNRVGPPTVVPSGLLATNVGRQVTDSLAAFGQTTYALTPLLNVTAGLRYTSEKRDIDTATVRTRVATGALVSSDALADTKRFNKLTWRIALDYQLTPDSLAYLSYNRGFKSGGYNISTPDVKSPYLPETLDAYEAGLKMQLLDRRLRINPSFFYYDYRNIQVGFFPGAFGGTIGITNGPKATIYGADIDLEVVLARGLKLFGGASLIHGRFGDFPNAIYSVPRAGGGNTTGTAASFGLNAQGNQLPFTSPFTGNLGLDYGVEAFGGKVTANTNLFYNDGYYAEVDNLRRVDDYVTLSASLGWTGRSGLGLRLWGKNLTNTDVVTQLGSTAGGTGISFEPPRTYGATLEFKF
ncbi:MAG TPA: TonB-dependent receptor, partial [Sphingomonas sp.]|uniref:TonB-dependent receptor n=1 Tax=Sphingomonas sp. TaxID=28214 RepID=UPI002ED826BD